MFQFIKKGMRRGISYIANLIIDTWKITIKRRLLNILCIKLMLTIYTVELRVNIYQLAVSNGYQKKQSIKSIWINVPTTAKRGFILEVDLGYSIELHDLHNDYPVAAAKQVKVTENMLSEYRQNNQQEIWNINRKSSQIITNIRQ